MSASFPFPEILRSASSWLMLTISYSLEVAADDTDSLLRRTTSGLPSVDDMLVGKALNWVDLLRLKRV